MLLIGASKTPANQAQATPTGPASPVNQPQATPTGPATPPLVPAKRRKSSTESSDEGIGLVPCDCAREAGNRGKSAAWVGQLHRGSAADYCQVSGSTSLNNFVLIVCISVTPFILYLMIGLQFVSFCLMIFSVKMGINAVNLDYKIWLSFVVDRIVMSSSRNDEGLSWFLVWPYSE